MQDGTPKLVFGPTPQTAADLVGTSWYLFSIDGTETGTQVQTLIFDTDDTVHGSGGCNSFSGPYTATDTDIAFGQLSQTMMFCDGPVGVDETAYFADLAKVTTWQFPAGAPFGSSLSLSGKDGVPALVFQAAGPAQASIAGTSWTLSSIDGTAVPYRCPGLARLRHRPAGLRLGRLQRVPRRVHHRWRGHHLRGPWPRPRCTARTRRVDRGGLLQRPGQGHHVGRRQRRQPHPERRGRHAGAGIRVRRLTPGGAGPRGLVACTGTPSIG